MIKFSMTALMISLAVLMAGCAKKEKQYAFQPSQPPPQPSISYGIYYEVALGSNVLTGSWTHHDKENGCNYTLTVNHTLTNVDATLAYLGETMERNSQYVVKYLTDHEEAIEKLKAEIVALKQQAKVSLEGGIVDGSGNFKPLPNEHPFIEHAVPNKP